MAVRKVHVVGGVTYYPINSGYGSSCEGCAGSADKAICNEMPDCNEIDGYEMCIFVQGEEARHQWVLQRLTE